MERGGDPRDHVSFILNDLALKLGHYHRNDERPENLMKMGQIFEDATRVALARRYAHIDPKRYVVVGEMQKDGVIGNPDLYDTLDNRIHEIKLTNKSSRHDIESDKFWSYWEQLKCYCVLAGTNRGGLHICFLRGDYRGLEMDYQYWEDEFTPQQLFETWRMMTTHREVLYRVA